MKILVTGGAGFIGSFLVDSLVRQGHTVRILDNLEPQVHRTGKPPSYLNPDAEFLHGDMRDYETVKIAVTDMEIIFHEASMVGVGQSQYEISKYIASNTLGTANLLDVLVNTKNKVQKLVVAASMSSYGEGRYKCNDCGPVRPSLRSLEQLQTGQWECLCPHCQQELTPLPTDEEARQNNNSVYGLSKMDQEQLCLIIGKTYSIPTVALRYFNVYGPRQSLSNPYTGVAAIFMSRIKNGHRPVIFEDGLQSRDFVSVHDIVSANLEVMNNPRADYNVYNIGSGNPLTIKSIAEKLADLYKSPVVPDITYRYRKGDIRHCFSDIAKIKKDLGWQPCISFEEGMNELIEWAQEAEAIDEMDKAFTEMKQKGLV